MHTCTSPKNQDQSIPRNLDNSWSCSCCSFEPSAQLTREFVSKTTVRSKFERNGRRRARPWRIDARGHEESTREAMKNGAVSSSQHCRIPQRSLVVTWCVARLAGLVLGPCAALFDLVLQGFLEIVLVHHDSKQGSGPLMIVSR